MIKRIVVALVVLIVTLVVLHELDFRYADLTAFLLGLGTFFLYPTPLEP